MLLSLQLAMMGLMLLYLGQCHWYMHRRNRRSWQTLLDQIDSHSHSSASKDPSDRAKDLGAIADCLRQRPHDYRGLWALFRNAGVVLEMADYAERNSTAESAAVDSTWIWKVRSVAMQIRLSAVMDLAKGALSKPTS